ncbi:hypothetical protein [Roseospira marina]|uniref:hypothetical protein n=1 Tax=Roseospira marina TaxID=140057 RepID=UPI001616C2F4|nr:hypothetical protein [Roseospira marina]MBB4314113.1 hypothetical protein [Roseospira marina]MBB5087274.1 hypothetical protein [Roseospira marina]
MAPSSDPAAPRDETDARRSRLAVQANPAERLDYRVTLTQPIPVDSAGVPARAGPAVLVVDYVPDRVVLDPVAFSRYAAALGAMTWPGLEALGVAILDDVNNEAVPRWLRVVVRRGRHRVWLMDRQPGWGDALGLTDGGLTDGALRDPTGAPEPAFGSGDGG